MSDSVDVEQNGRSDYIQTDLISGGPVIIIKRIFEFDVFIDLGFTTSSAKNKSRGIQDR